jgi:hypothetical protein
MFVGELACNLHLLFHLYYFRNLLRFFFIQGFLPVLFAALRQRHQRNGRNHLQQEPNQASEQPAKHHDKPLSGWKFLLFWLPALCDLTATTVSPSFNCEAIIAI